MGGDSIFLIPDGSGIVEMRSEPYESEDLLQRLLADYPDLLAGGQINPGVPRRWLLVRRELGVPGEEGGGGRWSLDHLFIDQDAIPTLVEVKRASDTRIRREVVGQMLDYAANGSRYWPSESLRSAFEARCLSEGTDSESLLAAHLGGGDQEGFWAAVGENVRSGRIRMVFVADVIHAELQRIIEFLNEQMTRAEVLGVEVRQYVGESQRTLVPRVFGLTAAAQQTKSATPKRSFAELMAEALPETRQAEQLLVAWAADHGVATRLSAAARQFITADGRGLASLYPGWDQIEFPIQDIRRTGAEEAADRAMDAIRAVSVSRKPTAKYPNVRCDDLVAMWDKGGRALFDAWLEIVQQAPPAGSAPFSYGGA